MKTIKYLFFILTSIVLATSCDKNETVIDEAWKIENEEAFDKQIFNPEYTKITSQSQNGFILYKVIEKGKGTVSPLFNDSVKVNYKGELINGKVFDSTWDKVPAKFTVGSMIDGFSTALQHMKVGDIWEVWIPQKLGYGTAGQGDIPAYSTLIFTIDLKEIVVNTKASSQE